MKDFRQFNVLSNITNGCEKRNQVPIQNSSFKKKRQKIANKYIAENY